MITVHKGSDGSPLPVWSPDDPPKPIYRITGGPNEDRQGKIAQTRWFGLRVCLNVPATESEARARYEKNYGDRFGEVLEKLAQGGVREWVWVWKWQVEVIPCQTKNST